jgi:plasmid stabilization system protein ParE
MIVIVSSAANADVISAADWLDERNPGTGREFTDRIEAALGWIGEFPNGSPPWPGRPHVRAHSLNDVQYRIFYSLRGDSAYVHAIMHQHRDPAIWLDRLT